MKFVGYLTGTLLLGLGLILLYSNPYANLWSIAIGVSAFASGATLLGRIRKNRSPFISLLTSTEGDKIWSDGPCGIEYTKKRNLAILGAVLLVFCAIVTIIGDRDNLGFDMKYPWLVLWLSCLLGLPGAIFIGRYLRYLKGRA